MAAPYSGHCLCGAIRSRVTSEPVTFYACHCTDCQRRTGSAFAPSLIEPWFVPNGGAALYERQPDPGEFAALWRAAHPRREPPREA